MTDQEKRDYVREIWTNPAHPASFTGPKKVYQIVRKEGKYKIGLGTIKHFLSNIETYTVQKPARQNFPRSRVIVSGLNAQWDGDLASMENVAQFNDNVKFLLILVDIFSRFLIVKTLKNKKSSTVASAIQSLLEKHKNRKPSVIRFDQGGEFKSEVKRFLTKQNIKVFYSQNSKIKSNYAERVIRTLKEKIYGYFMEKQTYRYIDVLQKIVDSYNHTPHQSLGGSTPASVNEYNEDEMRYVQYLVRNKKMKRKLPSTKMKLKEKKKKNKQTYKFKIGDFVRVSHLKRTFEKGYQEKWTVEYFKIAKRFKRDKQDIYKISDINGDLIQGSFYRYELQKINKSETDTFKIEKIIKRKKINGIKHVLVKWLGWPSMFNSWIPERDVDDI